MAKAGFLVVNKRPRWTSFDVVAKIRGITGIKDIGHAGTLDPFATGVLVIAVNRARLLVELVQQMDKVYRGRVRLGQVSDTDDIDGQKTSRTVTTPPSTQDVKRALRSFTGRVQQLPPIYSALKVQGRKMYELARKGLPVTREPRPVTIHQLNVLAYIYPHIDLEARVGRGTYIRAIARDLGEKLGTGGLLEALVRQRIGPFSLTDAIDVEDVSSDVEGRLSEQLSPVELAIGDIPRITLDRHALERLSHGQTITAPPSYSRGDSSIAPLAALDPQGGLQMLLRYDHTRHDLKATKIIDESWL